MNIEVLAGLSGMIIGIVAALTKAGIPTKFAPIMAAVLGIVIVCLLSNAWNVATILTGLVTGLAAVGLHTGIGTTKDAVVEAVGK